MTNNGLNDLIRGMILMMAIAFGGYTWGTPGSNPWTSACAGFFAVLYVSSARWFSND